MDEDGESRVRARIPVLAHGKVMVGQDAAHCVVRDLSEVGARLGLSRKIPLPRDFDLYLCAHDIRLRVRLQWRRGEHLGVSFQATDRLRNLVRGKAG
jgi:hypothetical protein